MLLKFGAVLSIICDFLMAIYTWTHLLQCIVAARSFLRMLKLRKLAVRKLYLPRGGPTWCHGVLEHGLNLHQTIPLILIAPQRVKFKLAAVSVIILTARVSIRKLWRLERLLTQRW